MASEQMITRLVAHNHLSCCDCDTYRYRMTQQSDMALKRWYVIELGEWSLAVEQRLRERDIDALFDELTQKEKAHAGEEEVTTCVI